MGKKNCKDKESKSQENGESLTKAEVLLKKKQKALHKGKVVRKTV